MLITSTRRIIVTGRDGSDFNTTGSLVLIHRFKQYFPRNAKWRKFINTSRKASRALIYMVVLTKSGMRIQGRRRQLVNKRSDDTAPPVRLLFSKSNNSKKQLSFKWYPSHQYHFGNSQYHHLNILEFPTHKFWNVTICVCFGRTS